ncbi:hypothetical protein VARIO8X_60303 [Burkholderiales bacterium 8X]|nr:hypothetical protein VARIO8X_60303 [Burkholderiales bacterium 8X]
MMVRSLPRSLQRESLAGGVAATGPDPPRESMIVGPAGGACVMGRGGGCAACCGAAEPLGRGSDDGTDPLSRREGRMGTEACAGGAGVAVSGTGTLPTRRVPCGHGPSV